MHHFSRFVWINLTVHSCTNKQFEQALIALNSCPAYALITDSDEIGMALTEHVYINTKEEKDLVLGYRQSIAAPLKGIIYFEE